MAHRRVFLSHKSQTKGRIKPLALALIEEGFPLFIDNPSALGWNWTFCEDKDISWIEGDYNTAIKDALNACAAVLGCLCDKIQDDADVWNAEIQDDADVWNAEIQAGHQSDKLVVCAIDDVRASDLPKLGVTRLPDEQLWRVQTVDQDPLAPCSDESVEEIRAQNGYSFVVAALKKLTGLETGRSNESDLDYGLVTRPSRREIRDVVPLAGRNDPYDDLLDVLSRARRAGGVHPILVSGPNAEEVIDFINGIGPYIWFKRNQSDVAIRRLGGPVVVTDLNTARRGDARTTRNGLLESIADHLRGQIGGSFEQNGEDRLRSVVRGLRMMSTHREPLLCVSAHFEIERKLGRGASFTEIEEWISTWRSIAEADENLHVVPILPVLLYGAAPEWKERNLDYPPIGGLLSGVFGECGNTRFFKSYFGSAQRIPFAKAPDGSRTEVSRIGIIEPIERRAAQTWTSNQLEKHQQGLGKTIKDRVDGLSGTWITMRDFSKIVEECVKTAGHETADGASK